jgi:D-alanyl-D-alanine carboxypeptidase (penicillin-binding protein 5/6)
VGTTVEAGSSSILVPKGKAGGLQYKVGLPANVTAPVRKGQVLGKVTCSLNGEVLQEYSIRANADVAPITFASAFRILLRSLLRAD